MQNNTHTPLLVFLERNEAAETTNLKVGLMQWPYDAKGCSVSNRKTILQTGVGVLTPEGKEGTITPDWHTKCYTTIADSTSPTTVKHTLPEATAGR